MPSLEPRCAKGVSGFNGTCRQNRMKVAGTLRFKKRDVQKKHSLENPHVQWDIHLQMVDFPLSTLFSGE